ncbi:MAG: hypothetical protein ACJ74E_11090 [Actinomycetes bacterium]
MSHRLAGEIGGPSLDRVPLVQEHVQRKCQWITKWIPGLRLLRYKHLLQSGQVRLHTFTDADLIGERGER